MSEPWWRRRRWQRRTNGTSTNAGSSRSRFFPRSEVGPTSTATGSSNTATALGVPRISGLTRAWSIRGRKLSVVVARPPAVNPHAPIADLTGVRQRAAILTGVGPGLGRFFVEDDRGNRLGEIRPETGFRYEMVLPSGEHLYLRTPTSEGSFRTEPGVKVAVGSLELVPRSIRSRGAVESSLRHGLFATPFGPTYYRGFVDARADLPPVDLRSEPLEVGPDLAGGRPRWSTARWAGLTLVAVGVVGIAVGAGDGLEVMSKNDEIDHTCVSGTACSTSDRAKYNGAVADAKTARERSIIGFAAGGAAAVAGSAIFLLTRPHAGRWLGVASSFGRPGKPRRDDWRFVVAMRDPRRAGFMVVALLGSFACSVHEHPLAPGMDGSAGSGDASGAAGNAGGGSSGSTSMGAAGSAGAGGFAAPPAAVCTSTPVAATEANSVDSLGEDVDATCASVAGILNWKLEPAGSNCTSPLDCSPVCSPCPNGKQHALTAWCDHGQCATADRVSCMVLGTPLKSCGTPGTGGSDGGADASACVENSTDACGHALGALGTCATGTTTCSGGKWGPCSVQKASADSCAPNNDDSCDGQHTPCLCGFTMPNDASSALPNPAMYDTSVSGVVVDKVTGLEWQSTTTETNAQGTAVATCTGSTLMGQSDWRLPTILELISLTDFSASPSTPTIDQSAFPGAPGEHYWSSTLAAGMGLPWTLDFGTGLTLDGVTPSTVRCVRVGTTPAPRCYPPGARFQIANGMVTDASTGLTWQQASSQQASWSTAKTYCAGATGGFRLPSVQELQTLVDYTIRSPGPPIDTTAFPDTISSPYWTSTVAVNASPAGPGLTVLFKDGSSSTYVGTPPKTRCVR